MSLLLYKAAVHQFISPAKVSTSLICLAHVSQTSSFFLIGEIQILSLTAYLSLGGLDCGRILWAELWIGHKIHITAFSCCRGFSCAAPWRSLCPKAKAFVSCLSSSRRQLMKQYGKEMSNLEVLPGERKSTSATYARHPEEGRSC